MSEITLTISGVREARSFLVGIGERADSEAFWNAALGQMMEETRRFAADISPVITGSYRAAHTVTVASLSAIMTIDPSARNTVSGVPVTQYAWPVEDRHQVYEQAGRQLERIVIRDSGQILERLSV